MQLDQRTIAAIIDGVTTRMQEAHGTNQQTIAGAALGTGKAGRQNLTIESIGTVRWVGPLPKQVPSSSAGVKNQGNGRTPTCMYSEQVGSGCVR